MNKEEFMKLSKIEKIRAEQVATCSALIIIWY